MYEGYYGLSGKPFQLNPDPSFYFASRGHQRAMAYLEYGLHQSEGFIVITGDVGAGKTTLVRNLLQKLDTDRIVAGQLVSTQLEAQDILRMVAAAFALPNTITDKADLLLSLETFLASVAAKGQRALLIVDEAQNLAPKALEELRMLSNFQIGEHSLLQSFLVGQPEFRETMRSPEMLQLRQRVLASYHLGPLHAEEAQAYVEHRLRHVDWKGHPAFMPDAFQAIYVASGGIPRRINTLCDRLMLSGFLAGKDRFSAKDVEEVAGELQEETALAPAGVLPSQSKAGAAREQTREAPPPQQPVVREPPPPRELPPLTREAPPMRELPPMREMPLARERDMSMPLSRELSLPRDDPFAVAPEVSVQDAQLLARVARLEKIVAQLVGYIKAGSKKA